VTLELDPVLDELNAWHEWRRAGIGASEVAPLVGLGATWAPSPWAIWAVKVGLVPPDELESDALTFGRLVEQSLAAWVEGQTGLLVRYPQHRAEYPHAEWMRATLDGLVVEHEDATPADAVAVFEAKSSSATGWAEGVPLHYRCQAQWQLAVTGLEVAYLAVVHMGHGHPRFELHEVARVEADIDTLVDRCERWWRDHVVGRVPPPVDGTASTSAALARAWLPLDRLEVDLAAEADTVDALRAVKRRIAELERSEAELANRVKAHMGDATEGVVAGELVATWRPHNRRAVDLDALRTRYPRAVARYTSSTSVRPFRLINTEDK
jgi:putative phage-type endonuclease